MNRVDAHGWPSPDRWEWVDGDWLEGVAAASWRQGDHKNWARCIVGLFDIGDGAGPRLYRAALASGTLSPDVVKSIESTKGFQR